MRHKITLPRRAAALVLALALMLTLPAVYASAGENKLQTSIPVVDGLTYQNTVSINNDQRVESFSFELSPDSSAYPILWQGSDTIYTGATINRAVANAQAAGYHVLGGINTDFFSMATGVPIGIVIEDGVYKCSNEGENAMVIIDGQVSIVEKPQVSMSLYDHATNITVIPNNFNKARQNTGGLYLLNNSFSTISTHSTGDGWYVRMKALPDPATGRAPDLTVNSALTLEVTELLLSNQSIVIGPDEYILTASDETGRRDAFMSFQVGDQVTLTTSCANPAVSAAQWAGGVGDIMIQNGAVTDSSSWVYRNDGRQPRTALGIKADGTLVLYAVDGRQSGYSIGLSQLDLADELLRRGCVTAVNLDGGGSTSLSLWVPGQNGPAIQNKPSGGTARACATYLLLVTDEKGDGTAQRLAPAQTGQVMLIGSTITLPKATPIDAGLNPVSSSVATLSYASLNGLGTISGNTYTAGWLPGTDTIRLSSAGGLEGTAQIHVVNGLTAFTVSRSGSTSALSSLQVKPGEQVQLTASGSYWGRDAVVNFNAIAVSVQGNVGTVDKNGVFTAAQTLGTGSITFSAGGLTRTVTVSSAYTHSDVASGHWAYDAVEYCYSKGIASGISSTQFGPDYSIIRGDFILMLYNAMGKPAVTAPCTFTDVSESDHFYTALAWGQQTGLASGVGEGKFAPRDYITREQAFSLLYRFLPVIGKSCPDGALSVLDQFKDKNMISSFAQTASATLVSQGLASGSDGKLDPKGTLTRAQMASLLYRVLEHTPVNPGASDTPSTPGASTLPGSYLLALDQSQVDLASGGSVTLNAIILPAVQNAAVAWTSSDPSAAPVSTTGMVTNLYPGTGTKTVTITASWNGQTASCTVTCQQAQHAGTVTGADSGLNVRSGPGTSYTAIGGLRNGAQAVILGYQDGWYQILFRNTEGQAAIGYVTSEYFTLDR